MQPLHLMTAKAALQEIQSKAGKTNNLRVPYKSLRNPSNNFRVNKWDALILDSEILGLLKIRIESMFSMFEPGLVALVKPEIDAALKTFLFAYTTGRRKPTPGMKLENIRYAPKMLTRRRMSALFLLSVGLPYIWNRFSHFLSSAQWTTRETSPGKNSSNNHRIVRERMLAVTKKLETFVITCQLVNLLTFLREGVYRSLPERCLGMKLESITASTVSRSINYDFMTRQLLWDGLMEFGNFVLPFLTWSCLRTCKILRGNLPTPSAFSSQCCLCGIGPPQTPYITSCKHVYCYYCLQTAVTMEDDYPCAACGVRFDSSRRLQT